MNLVSCGWYCASRHRGWPHGCRPWSTCWIPTSQRPQRLCHCPSCGESTCCSRRCLRAADDWVPSQASAGSSSSGGCSSSARPSMLTQGPGSRKGSSLKGPSGSSLHAEEFELEFCVHS